MDEFGRFLLIANISLFTVWISYKLLLNGTTFHGLNRGYLLIGSVVSLILPFVPFSVAETAIGVAQMRQLPELIVGSQIVSSISNDGGIAWFWFLYITGVLVSLGIFFRGIYAIKQVFNKSTPDVVQGNRVVRSQLSGPFSFLSVIHLPKELPQEHTITILKHELAHIKLRHSYDVLWFSFLRILFWFNPLTTIYLHTMQEVHEYQADAHAHSSSEKDSYVNVQLQQLFRLPQKLSVTNGFFNSINLKKRVNMIYSETTSKWMRVRYFIAIPIIASLGFLAACTETAVEDVQQVAEKVYREENIAEVDVMPEFPGGMEALFSYISTAIQYPAAAKEEGLTGKVYVGFVVNSEGKITELKVLNGVRDDLDSEAIRAISEMPNWEAGKSKGKNVSVEMVLPISFVLN